MATSETHLQRLVHRLQQTQFFKSIDEQLLMTLVSHAHWQTQPAGALLFLEGETAPGLYFVESGWIKVVKMSPEGREQILYFWGPGDLFGQMTAFINQPAPATAITLDAVNLWLLPRAALQQLWIDEPLLAQRTIEFMATRLMEMVELVGELALQPVMARLASRLLTEAENNIIQRHQWATQAQIAARIGAAPDVINRALRTLVEEGIIDLSRQQIQILDRPRLEEKAAAS